MTGIGRPLEDPFARVDAALRTAKHELNELRDNILNDDELLALLDAYVETGR